jgi:phosphopantetheine--protein transferase-like protein
MNTRTDQAASVAQPKPAPAATRQALVAIISELCELAPAQLGADFVLASAGRLRSSLGQATLDAKIRRRLGIKIENLHTLRTFGELEAAVAGNQPGVAVSPLQVSVPPPTEVSQPAPQASSRPLADNAVADSGLACGIDIESIAALPEAKDYWEEPFYKANFAPAEIAYCVSQSNPRMHFAARWCAKEAFKKCLPAYVQWEMKSIEVIRGEAGRPYLRVIAEDGTNIPPVALSLTHTEDWGLAIVVSEAERTPLHRPRPTDFAKNSHVGIALGLAALVCSVLALILALIHR